MGYTGNRVRFISLLSAAILLSLILLAGGPASAAVLCNYTFSEWNPCQPDGTQYRDIIASSPSGCNDWIPELHRSCTYTPQAGPVISFAPSSGGTLSAGQAFDFSLTADFGQTLQATAFSISYNGIDITGPYIDLFLSGFGRAIVLGNVVTLTLPGIALPSGTHNISVTVGSPSGTSNADWVVTIGGGGVVPDAVARIDSPSTSTTMQSIGGWSGGPFDYVGTLFPDAVTLINAGAAALPSVTPKFAGTPDRYGDYGLVVFSAVLAGIGDTSQVKTLIDFLDGNLTGDLFWSIDAATHALKILTGQNDLHNAIPVYTGLEVLDAVSRARQWLQSRTAVSASSDISASALDIRSGRVGFFLTNAAGEPYVWNDPNLGSAQPVYFELRMNRDYRCLSTDGGIASNTAVVRGGGTLVAGDEGDRTKTGYFALCNGYALREALRLGGNATPNYGWSLGSAEVLPKLQGSGLVSEVGSRKNARPGDLVVWMVGNTAEGIHHYAIIQSVEPSTFGDPTIIVRNKAETSGVFTANINASYYDPAWGTAHIYRFTGGEMPRMKIDTSKSGYKNPNDAQPYLQNVKATVSLSGLSSGAKSVLITATGDGIWPDKPFRKGFTLPSQQIQTELILPIGAKTIKAEAKDVSAADAENFGAGNALASDTKSITLTDDNFFNPLDVSLSLGTATCTGADWLNSWQKMNSGFSEYEDKLYSVAYGNGTFVVVGYNKAGGIMLTSTDGATWTKRTPGITEGLSKVAFGNGMFMAVGGKGTIITSPDGAAWTKRDPGTYDNSLRGIIYGNGKWVVLGTRYDGSVTYEPIILTSADGASWSVADSSKLYEAFPGKGAFGNGTFVAVCGDNMLITSPDGTTWTRRDSGITGELYGITYGNGTFVATGPNATIMTSNNGSSWTKRDPGGTPGSVLFHAAAYGDGNFVIVGEGLTDRGIFLTSTDGATWCMRNPGSTSYFYDVAYGYGMFIAVGNDGRILRSCVSCR